MSKVPIEELTKQVTKEDFEAYEEVRVSGRTNMFMLRTVQALSGLDAETIKLIMQNYNALSEVYGSDNN